VIRPIALGASLSLLTFVAGATLAPSVERVVLISVDGLRPDAIEKLGPKGTPNFHRLLREGTGTLNARSEPTWTYTMPNHVCMVTGRPSAGPEGHGYQENSFAGLSIHDVKKSYVASVFDVVAGQGRRAAMVSSKPKFELFRASYPRKLVQATVTEYDDARSIEVMLGLLRITRPPELVFLHLAGTDLTGHGSGFEIDDGAEYLEEVKRQDALIGRIFFAIDARRSLTKTTAIILTSDHGGSGHGHGDATRREHHRVPFLIWGPNVAHGVELERLNPSRTIRNCDAGNLALSLLELPPIPGSTYRDLQYSSGMVP
jgi:predicted AlkP superfamily pyrophosphatase or phosphodiesterase